MRMLRLTLIAVSLFAMLLVGCSTEVGTWNLSVGPLITSDPYDEDGKYKEPVDQGEWQKYYQSTKTSEVPAKVQSPQ